MSEPNIIKKAKFTPKVKTYLLVSGAIILTCTIVGIVLLPFYFIIAPFFIKKYYSYLRADLSERTLQFERGYIFHMEKTIPLDKIQDLTFRQGPLLKYFEMSILKVETAGGSAQGQANLKLIGIENAAEFRKLVLNQRDKVTNRTQPQSSSAADESTLSILSEIRDSLKIIEQKMD
ncbi:putative membrane protein [Fodinibius salinus]|uniref:Putative membrane protein n=1 Tax=Fodinibius salinus TaxID=860790 RepID=A0A5D3YLZ3_9BACT|nr:PH domain-containing protein [Fodinibius salinus]TYP95166.1 putative membrane protein [Fodinibius salinus]